MSAPTYEELKAQLAAVQKQVTTTKKGEIEFRVSEKGAVSVYGLGRFPTTLYYDQWLRVLEAAQQLRDFMELNKPNLKTREKKDA